jgi:predicted homoserine dehydrogenase-like protein
MNLYAKLCQRAVQDRAVRFGLIDAGKFGSIQMPQRREEEA